MNVPPQDLVLALAVIVLGASGTYLLLPHRHGSAKPLSVHIAGGILAALALVLFAALWRAPSAPLAGFFLYAFGLSAVAAGVLTITSKNPIHSALWFAVVVLSTSGLFMLAGAQFLAAGTVIVYAGAIIVTFLFVIMLAQMEGRAPYDRAARAPARATFSSYVLLWGLIYALLVVRAGPAESVDDRDARRLPRLDRIAQHDQLDETHNATPVLRVSNRDTLRLRVKESPEVFNGYGLQVTSWGDGSKVPTAGDSLVVAGVDDKDVLHIRVFDDHGRTLADTDETKLPDRDARAVKTLKEQLPGLLPPHVATSAEKDQVNSEVASIVDQTPFKPHVAGLGESFYTDHLISVELAGTLLFAALIGALAIATPKAPVRPGNHGSQTLTNA